tara:strand:- start:463 stop:675 length:213 start_codon:yes stop_codon:yes gene_type:complete
MLIKMKLENKSKSDDLNDIAKWLLDTFPKIKGKPMTVEVNQNGKINFIEIGYNLTIGDMKRITDKFPELA